MLIILGLLLVFFWFAVPELYGNLYDPGFMELFMTTFALGLFSFIVLVIGSFIAFVLGACFPKYWKLVGTETLVSLRNQTGVSGSFFLGTGTVDSEDYYYYYVGSAEKGYQPSKIEVDGNVTIFEEERADGELKTFSHEFTSDIFSLFGISIGKRYEFRIPKGSLVQNFELH